MEIKRVPKIYYVTSWAEKRNIKRLCKKTMKYGLSVSHGVITWLGIETS